MHDIVRSIRRGQGIAEIDEHGGAPGGAPRFDIALAVAHHEALLEINAEFHSRLEDHARLRFAAVAVLAMAVEAGFTASRGNSRAVITCIASTSEWAIKPSPTSGWLVTTAKRNPACFSF